MLRSTDSTFDHWHESFWVEAIKQLYTKADTDWGQTIFTIRERYVFGRTLNLKFRFANTYEFYLPIRSPRAHQKVSWVLQNNKGQNKIDKKLECGLHKQTSGSILDGNS